MIAEGAAVNLNSSCYDLFNGCDVRAFHGLLRPCLEHMQRLAQNIHHEVLLAQDSQVAQDLKGHARALGITPVSWVHAACVDHAQECTEGCSRCTSQCNLP